MLPSWAAGDAAGAPPGRRKQPRKRFENHRQDPLFSPSRAGLEVRHVRTGVVPVVLVVHCGKLPKEMLGVWKGTLQNFVSVSAFCVSKESGIFLRMGREGLLGLVAVAGEPSPAPAGLAEAFGTGDQRSNRSAEVPSS